MRPRIALVSARAARHLDEDLPPLLAALACLRSSVRACQAVTITAGVVSFATVLVLVPTAAHQDLALGRYLRADAISVVFLLATPLVRKLMHGVH